MKTILKWNDETLAMSVACPAVKDDEVVENLKHLVETELVLCQVALSLREAREKVEEAYQAGLEEETEEIHMSDFCASIRYGSDYETRWEVVEMPWKPDEDHFWIVTHDNVVSYKKDDYIPQPKERKTGR